MPFLRLLLMFVSFCHNVMPHRFAESPLPSCRCFPPAVPAAEIRRPRACGSPSRGIPCRTPHRRQCHAHRCCLISDMKNILEPIQKILACFFFCFKRIEWSAFPSFWIVSIPFPISQFSNVLPLMIYTRKWNTKISTSLITSNTRFNLIIDSI